MKSYYFPSSYEHTNRELQNVSDNLISGLKIKMNEKDFIVGDLALREGYSPHKNINSGPSEEEFQLLLQAGLLIATSKADQPLNLTVGFPFSTYMLYRNEVKDVIGRIQEISFDKGTYEESGIGVRKVEIANIDVIPEIHGCVTAIREGQMKVQNNFFIVSLGFGTCEAVMSTSSGILNRTAVSMSGIRYAVNLFESELSKEHYLDLKTEHQLDVLFRQGSITINRKRYDVTDLRRKVLKMYYSDVISPRLKKAFSDDDFNKCNQMYIAGGGAYYQDLIDCFKEEYRDSLTISVYPEPEKCASQGYCIHSKLKFKEETSIDLDISDPDAFLRGGKSTLAVGLDVGNSGTCVTFMQTNND